MSNSASDQPIEINEPVKMSGMSTLIGANKGFKVPNPLVFEVKDKNCVAKPKNHDFLTFFLLGFRRSTTPSK